MNGKAIVGLAALLVLLFLFGCTQTTKNAQNTSSTYGNDQVAISSKAKAIYCAELLVNLEAYQREIAELESQPVKYDDFVYEILKDKYGLYGLTDEDIGICSFFYLKFCDKIQPEDLEVRRVITEATKKHAGTYSLDQVLDAYAWIKENIVYLNAPLTKAEPYPPSETIYVGSGDCKNQAALIASMIEAIGGRSRIVIMTECQHAFAQVYVGDESTDTQALADRIGERHPFLQGMVHTQKSNNETWLTLDPAGAIHAGGVHPNCMQVEKQYVITRC